MIYVSGDDAGRQRSKRRSRGRDRQLDGNVINLVLQSLFHVEVISRYGL